MKMRRLRLPTVQVSSVAMVLVAIGTIALVIWVLLRQADTIERDRAMYDELHQAYEELYEEAVREGASPSQPKPDNLPEPEPATPVVIGPSVERWRTTASSVTGAAAPRGATASQAPRRRARRC
jgi:cytoskeletal protein RodZ